MSIDELLTLWAEYSEEYKSQIVVESLSGDVTYPRDRKSFVGFMEWLTKKSKLSKVEE